VVDGSELFELPGHGEKEGVRPEVWKHLSVERWGPQGSVKFGDKRSLTSQLSGGHCIPDARACGDEWA
jgi:hypothetical protein